MGGVHRLSGLDDGSSAQAGAALQQCGVRSAGVAKEGKQATDRAGHGGKRQRGRPPGEARRRLLDALQIGGDVNALSEMTGMHKRLVQRTIANIRRDGLAAMRLERRAAIYSTAPSRSAGADLAMVWR